MVRCDQTGLSRATGQAQTGRVGFDIDRLVRLWNGSLPPGDEAALADFRAVYTDPVTLNGAAVAVSELVAMARTMQRSHENAERTVVDLTQTQDAAGRGKVAFAFLLRARVDGRPVEMRGVDLLTIADGRISAVWAAAQPAS